MSGCVNPWNLRPRPPSRATEKILSVAYLRDEGRDGKYEIIRSAKCVVPLACSPRNKILSLSPGEFLLISRFLSATPRLARGNKYLTWFFFQPFVLSLDPMSALLHGPFAPANFLFSLPHFPQVRSLSRDRRTVFLYPLLPSLITFLIASRNTHRFFMSLPTSPAIRRSFLPNTWIF